jgi:hypothetical protein
VSKPPVNVLSEAHVNHLRRLLGWVRCDIGQSPDEYVMTVRRITERVGLPDEAGQQRVMTAYREAKAVPQYVRAAVKSLEQIVREPSLPAPVSPPANAETRIAESSNEGSAAVSAGGDQSPDVATESLKSHRVHLSVDIAGLLRNEGHKMTLRERKGYELELHQGRKLIALCHPSECPDFDYQTGCPGHVEQRADRPQPAPAPSAGDSLEGA